MSEAFACFMCGGHGYVLIDDGDDEGRIECQRCNGSGGLNLCCAGPGVPKSDDPYVAVPRGVNW